MHTADTPKLNTIKEVEAEMHEVARLTNQLFTATADEPHARVISACFTALGVLADTHPCCRATVSQVAMQMGLQKAAMPEPSANKHVH